MSPSSPAAALAAGATVVTPNNRLAREIASHADAARRAVSRGSRGIYNIAEPDETVSSEKAVTELGWSADFRIVS